MLIQNICIYLVGSKYSLYFIFFSRNLLATLLTSLSAVSKSPKRTVQFMLADVPFFLVLAVNVNAF